MNNKILILCISLLAFFLFSTQQAYGFEKASGSSAILTKGENAEVLDNRAKILRKFLESYKSPLVDSADTFVEQADIYDLDWRLVASIAGVESTFAHHLPYESYNAWGWGIYGDQTHSFKSYDNGIETISESLRTKYINKWGATDVYKIGKYYASSPTWAQKVEYFMNRIERFEAQNKADTLSISI